MKLWESSSSNTQQLSYYRICSPLTERAHLQDHPHLQELELADSVESLNSIDILIGLDHYWDFVTGESIRGDFGKKGRHYVQC